MAAPMGVGDNQNFCLSVAAILDFAKNSEIQGSISQPLEPLQPKSLYIQNLWASAILMHPNLSTSDKYWAS